MKSRDHGQEIQFSFCFYFIVYLIFLYSILLELVSFKMCTPCVYVLSGSYQVTSVILCCFPCRWISEEWEHCTKTCSSLGFQIRTVRCVQFLHDGTNRSIHSKYCSGEKPESRRPCNRVPCPAQWRTGAWSEVSTECICSSGRGPYLSYFHVSDLLKKKYVIK